MPKTPSVRELTQDLISRESITPRDEGCQDIINEILASHGFRIQDFSLEAPTNTGPNTVTNTLAFYEGRGSGDGPSIIFAGHTDVVDVKNQDWQTDPFKLTDKDGLSIGRGIADMKGGLAPMVTAACRYVAENPSFSGKIGFVVTSFEEIAEDPALDVNELGTNYVVKKLQEIGYPVDYVILGEPSAVDVLGDIIKNGRRGTVDVTLDVTGEGGHTAQVSPTVNPLIIGSSIVGGLVQQPWEASEGNFPPTVLNFSSVEGADTKSTIPSKVIFTGNARFGTPYNGQSMADDIEAFIRERAESIIRQIPADSRQKVAWKTTYNLSGETFLTPENSSLISAAKIAIKKCLGITTELSTGGGTSDGRYLAVLNNAEGRPAQVIEIGHIEGPNHKVDEAVPTDDLKKLEQIHYELLSNLLG